MKKSILLLAIFLSACTSMPEPKELVAQKKLSCVYPYSSEVAPEWICDRFTAEGVLSAVGVSEQSAGGIGYMRDTAFINAELLLVDKIKFKTDEVVRKHLSVAVIKDNDSVDRAINSVVNHISRDSFYIDGQSTKSLKDKKEHRGKQYVLVGIMDNDLRILVKRAILSGINDQPLVWQKFRLDKSYSEMVSAIVVDL